MICLSPLEQQGRVSVDKVPNSCMFTVCSVMDSDVAALPMVRSGDAATSSSREPAAGDVCDEGPGDEIGERRGKYPPDLGDTGKHREHIDIIQVEVQSHPIRR